MIQRFQICLASSTVRKLSDEALITIHQEHLKVRADELAEITRVELDRRGLALVVH